MAANSEISLPQAISTQPTEQIQVDEKPKEQLEATLSFARYLTSKHPQVDDMRKITVEVSDTTQVELPELPQTLQSEPQLNYYLAGSLAAMLLSQAETIDLCEETSGSSISISQTKTVPEATRNILAQFARPIGDVDYVPTAHYKKQQRGVQQSYGKVSSEEYRQKREKYLWKGGGPQFNELPPEALPALKKSERQIAIMIDPVQMYGADKFARIHVNGEEYYIARPDTIIGYKVLHLLQKPEAKSEKFKTEFPKLFEAVKGLYSEEELIQLTQHVLQEYEESHAKVAVAFNRPHEPRVPKLTQDLLAKPDLDPTTRAFIEKIMENVPTPGTLN